MARRDTEKTKGLEVRVMFEPNRLSPACIAQAYERVAPIARPTTASLTERSDTHRDETKRRAAGGAP